MVWSPDAVALHVVQRAWSTLGLVSCQTRSGLTMRASSALHLTSKTAFWCGWNEPRRGAATSEAMTRWSDHVPPTRRGATGRPAHRHSRSLTSPAHLPRRRRLPHLQLPAPSCRRPWKLSCIDGQLCAPASQNGKTRTIGEGASERRSKVARLTLRHASKDVVRVVRDKRLEVRVGVRACAFGRSRSMLRVRSACAYSRGA